jgi:hypothetical protein
MIQPSFGAEGVSDRHRQSWHKRHWRKRDHHTIIVITCRVGSCARVSTPRRALWEIAR